MPSPQSLYFALPLFFVADISLLYGAFYDIRDRKVNSFLFVPLFVFALVIYAIAGYSPVFIGISSAFFVITFFDLKPLTYALTGILFLGIFIIIDFITGLSYSTYFLYFIVLFMIYIIGTGERYFGIGDIKALIALSFSFLAPFQDSVTAAQSAYLSLVPFDMVLLINTAIISLLFIPYLAVYNYRRAGKIKAYHLFAVDYDQKLYGANPERYRIADYRGSKIMVYGAPTLLTIYIAFFISYLAGLWFI